jgi:GSCFA family
MEFRTELNLQFSAFKLQNDAKILTIGSCFSEVLGNQLVENKLSCMSNPYGTTFNPYSIFKVLSQAIQHQPVSNHLFVENQDIWHHYDFHSNFWAKSKDELAKNLNETHRNVGNFLKKANYLVITFGTAWVYQLRENSQAISNCHKMPAQLFKRELLGMPEITRRFAPFYETMKMHNPKLKIILTVSPVRHTRDTLQLNSVSKAMLRGACHCIEQEYKDVYYFPSYEIMTDDLRDYRFYKADLIHPNEMAEEYIFEKFSEAYFSEELKEQIRDWQKIKTSLNHRTQYDGTEVQKEFLVNLLVKLESFKTKIDVSEEIEAVKSKLVA